MITTVSTAGKRRVLKRAVAAWKASHPHEAWEILAGAGMADLWPAFRRACLREARRRYLREINRHSSQ